MKKYSIVTNNKIIRLIKASKYWKLNLGMVATIEKSGERVYNERDKFSFFYNNQYRTTIEGKGSVGDIMIYLDHYIKEDVLAMYLDNEEFVFKLDNDIIREKSIDFYLGHLLKELDTEYQRRMAEKSIKKGEVKPEGDASALMKNPGSVSYEDIEAYLKKKQAERYLVQEIPKKE